MLGFGESKIGLIIGEFCKWGDILVEALSENYFYGLVDFWLKVVTVMFSGKSADLFRKREHLLSCCFKQILCGSSKILSTRYGLVFAVIAGLISFSSKI